MCPPQSGSVSVHAPENAADPASIPDCVPTDDISKFTYGYASGALHPVILNHSLRVYLFAKALAEREQSAWASPARLPLLFAACMYHDVGTCSAHDGSWRFEVDGADAAAQGLGAMKVSEADVHEVWVAIALHTSPHIAERISPLARLVRWGVTMDFKRPAAMKFTTDVEVEANERLFPRREIEKVLGDAVVEQALQKPEKAPMVSWPGVMLESKLENPEWEGVNKAF